MTTGNQLIARFEKFANPQLAEKVGPCWPANWQSRSPNHSPNDNP